MIKACGDFLFFIKKHRAVCLGAWMDPFGFVIKAVPVLCLFKNVLIVNFSEFATLFSE